MLQEHWVTSIFHGTLSHRSTLVHGRFFFALPHLIGVTISIFWEIALTSLDVVVKAGDAVDFSLDALVAFVEFGAPEGMWKEFLSRGRTFEVIWERKKERSNIGVYVLRLYFMLRFSITFLTEEKISVDKLCVVTIYLHSRVRTYYW